MEIFVTGKSFRTASKVIEIDQYLAHAMKLHYLRGLLMDLQRLSLQDIRQPMRIILSIFIF